MSEEKEEKKKPRKPRRRWRRWALGLLLFLGALLLWANGPGARWAVESVLLKELKAQKLSGTFEVEGSLHSGLAIRDLDLTGESKLQSVESDLVKIDWTIRSLIAKELKAITIRRLDVIIDPKAPPLPKKEKPKEKKDPTASALKTLDLIRGLLQPSEISISDLSVEVVGITSVSLGALEHTSGDTKYFINDLNGRDHLNRQVLNRQSILTWDADGFDLNRLNLLPDLSVHGVTFNPGENAAGKLIVSDQVLTARSNLNDNHHIELESQQLSLSSLARLYDPEIEVGGAFTKLEIDSRKGIVVLEGRDLKWEKTELPFVRINARADDITKPLDAPVTLSAEVKSNIVDQLNLEGTIIPTAKILDSKADLNFTLQDARFPTVTGDIAFENREALLKAEALKSIQLEGSYQVENSTYLAKVSTDLTESSKLHEVLAGQLKFSATAQGDLKAATHQGQLNLERLELGKPELPDAETSAVINWDWPKEVTVSELHMVSPEGRIDGRLSWSNEVLNIESLTLTDQEMKLLNASGKLPAPLKIESLEAFLDSDAPVDFKLDSEPVSIKKISSFLPVAALDKIAGTFEANLELKGTITKPKLDGFATLTDLQVIDKPEIPATDIALNFRTQDQQLILQANASEPGGPLLNAEGTLPFLPRAWIDREVNPNASPISFRAKSPALDLRRIQPFVPQIEKIDGNLKLDFLAQGTISEPKLSGSAIVTINGMKISDSPISDFRNSRIELSFAGDKVTLLPSNLTASGGTANFRGTVDLAQAEPVLDIYANGRYLMLYRTADFSFRGHPKLRLNGPISAATLSGTIELAESLIYKDVEILPFGVPRTTNIPRPTLPTFVPAAAKTSEKKKSGGVKDWKLDVRVTTEDPILIRGNLARGEIIGNVQASGTIGDPKTSGTLETRDLVADLPFSDLKVQSSKLTLRPEAIDNPTINLRGTSSVGEYLVQVFVSGPVKNPRLVLSSNPPLPESEIMLLLATGSASAQLEDRKVASQKALQYLLEGLRRRNRGKDDNIFQRLLKNSDQIELSLGDSSQYSGRKFSSATLELNDQWDFTTQIDEQGRTRALVVFSLRFR